VKENGLPAQGDTKPSTGRPEGRRSIDSRPSDWPDYFGSNALLLLVQGWAGGGRALSHIKILQKFRFFFLRSSRSAEIGRTHFFTNGKNEPIQNTEDPTIERTRGPTHPLQEGKILPPPPLPASLKRPEITVKNMV